MVDMTKWEGNRTLTPEEEPEYLKDFCAYLREQQTLSEVRKEGESQVCEIVPDEMSAHAADIIEELWERLQLWEGCGMEFDSPEEQKASLVSLRVMYETSTGKSSKKPYYGQYPGVPDDFVYEISKGIAGRAASK